MRARSVAALYDVHGNLPALEAVLGEVDALEPDLVLVGGDAVLGPMPRETLERLLRLGREVRFVRGNADREAADGTGEPARGWPPVSAPSSGTSSQGFRSPSTSTSTVSDPSSSATRRLAATRRS